MSASDYPAGAENDPKAPWNEVEKEPEECKHCWGYGDICEECDQTDGLCECEEGFSSCLCHNCNGTGEEDEQ